MTSSGSRLHVPAHTLLTELRKAPFRPILLEDLRSLNPRVSSEPIRVAVSETGYRTLYENTFAFTKRDDKTNLALFEVGFRFRPDGSIALTGGFRRHNALMKKLLSHGLDTVLSEACRTWAERAESRGFDPNDEAYWGANPAWSSLLERGCELEDSVLTEKEAEVIAGSGGAFGFGYMDGLAFYHSAPVTKSAAHSHIITHSDASSYFPSAVDCGSKVLWAIVDPDFIKKVLADLVSHQERVKRIIDHHVAGMKEALCMGAFSEKPGSVTALIRAV